MSKKATILSTLALEKRDFTILVLDGIDELDLKEGQKLRCGGNEAIIDHIPLASRAKKKLGKRASVGVNKNVFHKGDVVEIL